jgi:transcriptional repressor NrdR
MLCQSCGYSDSSVVYTRHHEQKNLTERRRECLKCGVRYTTHERLREQTYHKTIPPTNVLPK